MMWLLDSETNRKGPEHGLCEADLDRGLRMLEEHHTHFERAVPQENVHLRLSEEKIEVGDAKAPT